MHIKLTEQDFKFIRQALLGANHQLLKGLRVCSAGQLCFNSEPFVPNRHGSLVGMVHQDAALHGSQTMREATELQLHRGKPKMDAKERREAAGHLLELLGLLPIQSVLVRDAQSAGNVLAEQQVMATGMQAAAPVSIWLALHMAHEASDVGHT